MEALMDALALFVSWQAVIVAGVTVTVAGGIKQLISVLWKTWKDNRIMAKLVMPAIVLVLGTVVGMFLPLRPEAVTEYVTANTSGPGTFAAFGGWGFVTGGVAGSWIFDKTKEFFQFGKAKKKLKTPSVPPPP